MAATVAVNGATLAYEERGAGEWAFVFIHGWAGDRSVWRPQVEDLSRDFRCISVDLRGCGESSPTPPFDIVTAADDVAAVMDAAGVERGIVVGHSLGGVVALHLNARHGDRVLGVVAGDAPFRPEGDPGPMVEALRSQGSMEAARQLVESFFRAGTPLDVSEHVREVMLGTPVDVAAGMLEGMAAFPNEGPRLLKLADAKPFMAIWAAADPAGDIQWLRETLVFLRHESVAGGHFFQLEHPEMTNALLRAFVVEVERDPRITGLREG